MLVLNVGPFIMSPTNVGQICLPRIHISMVGQNRGDILRWLQRVVLLPRGGHLSEPVDYSVDIFDRQGFDVISVSALMVRAFDLLSHFFDVGVQIF
jgi:hypothetical protein